MKMRVSSARAILSMALLVLASVAGLATTYRVLTRSSQDSLRGPEAAVGRSKGAIAKAYGSLPLAFEKNVGQTDDRVRFLARGNGYELFLTQNAAVLALRQDDNLVHSAKVGKLRDMLRPTGASLVRVQFEGANRSPDVRALDKLPGRIDYFEGNNPKNWHANVPAYSQVQYRDLYSGIDGIFYGNQGKFEYDLVVAPGAETRQIAVNLQGARKLKIDTNGNLVAALREGKIYFRKPLVYQEIDGQRTELAAAYELTGDDRFGFRVSQYDHSKPLVIDPVLDYSSFLGGSAGEDIASGIAVDSAGNAYVTGTTLSTTFPTTSSGYINGTFAGNTNGAAFVTELDPTGSTLLYSSYLSGSGAGYGGEAGQGIAVDPGPSANCVNAGTSQPGVCVYVTGYTFSSNFPVVNGFDAGPGGTPPTAGNVFVAKINPNAATPTASLVYSTYISGNATDAGFAIAADASANAYVVGGASSTNFPTTGGYQTTLASTNGDAFLTRINTAASGAGSLVYSTYLGGASTSTVIPSFPASLATGVAVDSSNNAYIVGDTVSTTFPTTSNAFVAQPLASAANQAVFVARINTATTGTASLVYSTYLANPTSGVGTKGDYGTGIALGPNVNTSGPANQYAYVTGATFSNFYVTANSYPSSPSTTTGVAFLSLVDTSGGGVPYSTIIGGSNGDLGASVQTDSSGNAYVAGVTGSTTPGVPFPTTPGAFQTVRPNTTGDGFVFKLNPGGHGAADLLYSTYFGGSGGPSPITDEVNGIAIDGSGNAYVAGRTPSANFPTTSGAFQTSLTQTDAASSGSGFVSKLTLVPTLAFGTPCTYNFTVTPTASCALTFGNQLVNTSSTAMTFALTNNTSSNITLTFPMTASGANGSDFVAAPATSGSAAACSTTAPLAGGASCGIGVTFTPTGSGAESALLSVGYTYNNGLSATAPGTQTVVLTGTSQAPAVVLNPATTLAFGNQPQGTTSTPPMSVTVTNNGAGTLNFTAAPVIGGTNPTDFAIVSGTTCTNGGSVAPSSSCVINVTFTPASVAPFTATLTIADNATGSPQTITLTGTGVAAAAIATVSPSPLTFTGELVTTTSAAQAVTVQNTGSAALNITATPVISGTNATDFAIASGSTCTNGASVAPGNSCVINVTFTPPANVTGTRSAMLSIADNATGSPQTVTISGTAWDFTVGAQAITVTAGKNGTITATVTGLGGFTGAVSLSCSTNIPQGSCMTPTSVNASAAGATASVTVITRGLIPAPLSPKTPPISTQQVLLAAFALLLLMSLPLARRFRTRLSLAGAAAILVVVAGCSSPLPTPPGTYTVTITGSSSGLSRAATVNVTVQGH